MKSNTASVESKSGSVPLRKKRQLVALERGIDLPYVSRRRYVVFATLRTYPERLLSPNGSITM
jgi:hypothetical protein